MVVVLAQPVWGFGDYFEAYRFELPCAVPDLLIRIEAFYRWRRIDEVVREQNRLAFIRGSRWATWFSPDERLQPQQVEISVTNDPHAVTCEYTVFNWGPNIFIPPRKLEQEVRRLETFLLANIHRPLQELSRSR